MLSAYAKGQKTDISKAERNALKKLIPQLLNEYAKRRMQ
jgi:hypothetical protein